MASTSFSGPARITLTVILLLTCCAVAVAPASAATKYLGGSPSFSVSVIGVNEFVPGQDATISILVKNTGLNTMKQLNQGTIEAEDLPTTAKFVTIGLTSDNDEILIKTDPQMMGDIPAGGTGVPVQFHLKISTNATDREYLLPLEINYKYLRVMSQEAADVYEYTYNTANDTLPVTLHIRPLVKIDVIEVVPEQLSVGSQGYINLKIRNSGPENGEMAAVKLLRNGHSPVIPTDSNIFIGNFPSGGIIECRYKVSVSNDAMNQTYPVDVAVTYTNQEGTIVTSLSSTVGVPVNGKTAFTVMSPASEVPQGASRTIDVQFRNNGNVTVYNVQARIAPHDPVTIKDNDAFLGDLEPNQTAIASYEIQADAAAHPQMYTFDSTLRYRDALGNSQMSDIIPVQIAIVPSASGSSAVPGGLLALVGCVIAVIVIGSALLVYRKKKESR